MYWQAQEHVREAEAALKETPGHLRLQSDPKAAQVHATLALVHLMDGFVTEVRYIKERMHDGNFRDY